MNKIKLDNKEYSVRELSNIKEGTLNHTPLVFLQEDIDFHTSNYTNYDNVYWTFLNRKNGIEYKIHLKRNFVTDRFTDYIDLESSYPSTFSGKVTVSYSPSIEEFRKLKEDLKFYKDAFNNCEDTINAIWEGLYGDLPVCDTGNFWNCNPIIKNRIIKDFGKNKSISSIWKFGWFWIVPLSLFLGMFLGKILS